MHASITDNTSPPNPSGAEPIRFAFLARKSTDFTCSHIKKPDKPVEPGSGIWNGVFRSVLVIGQQMASPVARLNAVTLTTSVGSLPCCSCPACGSNERVMKSRQRHGPSVAQLEERADPPAPPPDAPVAEPMAHRLETKEGREIYVLRKQTVEPVFGIIKQVLGFRRFLLRGREKVSMEWELVSTSYKLKRLYNLGMRLKGTKRDRTMARPFQVVPRAGR